VQSVNRDWIGLALQNPSGGSPRNVLLSALPGTDLARLEGALHHFELIPGTVLHEPGDPIGYVVFPHSGMVSLQVVLGDSDSIEANSIGRDGIIDAAAAMTRHRAFTRAVVQLAGIASRMPATDFRRFVRDCEALRDLVFAHYVGTMWQVEQRAACAVRHDIVRRLSRWLLQAHDRSDGDTLPFTQDTLAQLLGVRRASVTLAARRLQGANLIAYSYGSITILDRAGLERRSCECYRIMHGRSGAVGYAVREDT
jgi:CRP-like cAMP-binding protein